MQHGKRYGYGNKPELTLRVKDFPKEIQEQYYKECAEVDSVYKKALFDAENNYNEVVKELKQQQEAAIEMAKKKLAMIAYGE